MTVFSVNGFLLDLRVGFCKLARAPQGHLLSTLAFCGLFVTWSFLAVQHLMILKNWGSGTACLPAVQFSSFHEFVQNPEHVLRAKEERWYELTRATS